MLSVKHGLLAGSGNSVPDMIPDRQAAPEKLPQHQLRFKQKPEVPKPNDNRGEILPEEQHKDNALSVRQVNGSAK